MSKVDSAQALSAALPAPATSGKHLVRIYLPANATTLIQVATDQSMLSVLQNVCEKKLLQVDDHAVKVKHTPGGKGPEVEVVADLNKSYSSYGCPKEIQIVNKGQSDTASQLKQQKGKSTKTGPAADHQVKMTKVDMPQTLAQSPDDGSGTENSSKASESANGGQAAVETFVRRAQREIKAALALATLSITTSDADTGATGGPEPPTSPLSPVSAIYSSTENLAGSASGTNMVFISKRMSLGGTVRSTSIRRSHVRGRSGSVGSVDKVTVDKMALEVTLIRVTIDAETTTIKMSKENFMEDILRQVLDPRNLPFDDYCLEFMDGTPAEMDRKWAYYQQLGRPAEMRVIKGPQAYSTLVVIDDGNEVMIMQNAKNETVVMAGLPEKLLERATDGSERNPMVYADILLLTYRSFMASAEFFENLILRFNAEPAPDATEEEKKQFEQSKGTIQLAVLDVLSWWIKYHWDDFGLNADLKNDLVEFVDFLKECGDQFMLARKALVKAIDDKVEMEKERINQAEISERRKKTRESMFDEIETLVLAQQMTMHNFGLFARIHPMEFLKQIWKKDDDPAWATPNLDTFSARFDLESYWVATELVGQKDMKQRVNMMRKFIQLAQECKECHNFFSMFSIYVGLNLTPVQRLKKTWEGIGQKHKALYDEIEKSCSPSRNMKAYRDLLAESKPPILPFLPILMKDLTFMQDGNPSKYKDMINFDKLRMMANRVREITNLMDKPFKFPVDPAVENFLQKPHVERDLAKLKEESVKCEPQ